VTCDGKDGDSSDLSGVIMYWFARRSEDSNLEVLGSTPGIALHALGSPSLRTYYPFGVGEWTNGQVVLIIVIIFVLSGLL